MILLTAILFILFEAITEGLLRKFNLASWLFDSFCQNVTALALYIAWLLIAFDMNGGIPGIKLMIGFIFVRFLIFDVAYNLANGKKWYYYGDTKLYDRVMTKLASWGWFVKFVLGIVGITFLLGIN